ncbi:MAG: precorrin-6Y C5,15-methyltransferase (decarboxylating) subunit CbiT [Luteococcus sp.]|uniref:precorrin-6Y C5,15-methyltransferase (decarboxylating) subunit CbiT n=1 Tax=Luteococcus sp. TaxID=1969402 RepID=UPI0026484CD4|nr:precorrin-6Y C5,15-methyltransferase (decarboxylating) subunit CbiT [Luteococcus sp.]MDN5563137.1 precorrin-6Y C5,15-methyltransferase (decarboxylating) subunit CbiT [Luteococcus sp.]
MDLSPLPGRSDDCFEHDGLITKRAVRALALIRLRPAPGELLWDVGLGSGAVAIEWALAAPGARAIGLERREERADRARRNVTRFGLDERIDVRLGAAGELVTALAKDEGSAPDAVFFGGGVDRETVRCCWAALRPGGRLVVHGVTLETAALLVELHRELGGELSRIQLEAAEPIGRFTGWKPARPIVQWVAHRPAEPVTA